MGMEGGHLPTFQCPIIINAIRAYFPSPFLRKKVDRKTAKMYATNPDRTGDL